MRATTFGPRAERVALSLPSEAQDIVVAEAGYALPAFLEAYRRRVVGEPVRAMALVDDASALLARRVFSQVCSSATDRHARARALAAFAAGRLRIAGQAPEEVFGSIVEPDLALLNFLWIAGEVVVRSCHEQRRLFGWCGHRALPVTRLRLEDPRVPRVTRVANADLVVVWAPEFTLGQLGPLCMALEDLRLSVAVITRDGRAEPYSLQVVGLDRAADVLARARIIIDASTESPDSAHALARIGAPLLVSAPFAAEPTLEGAVPYDAAHGVVIEASIRSALGARAPRLLTSETAPSSASPRSARVEVSDASLVSFIVPTCRRPDLLARALQSIERQRWPSVEAVVINDGPDDVSSVVAQFPRARLLVSPKPGSGPSMSRNFGLEAARGEFIGFLDDDDWLLADHAERLVGVLERGRADIAYSDLLVCFVRRDETAQRHVEGLEVYPTVQELERMQFVNLLVLPSLMLRRSLLAGHRFDETLLVCEDYDLWLRLLRLATPCYHPVPTAVFTWWQGVENQSNLHAHLFVAAYERVYARNPTDSPLVESQRQAHLSALRQHGRPLAPAAVLGRYLSEVDTSWMDALLT